MHIFDGFSSENCTFLTAFWSYYAHFCPLSQQPVMAQTQLVTQCVTNWKRISSERCTLPSLELTIPISRLAQPPTPLLRNTASFVAQGSIFCCATKSAPLQNSEPPKLPVMHPSHDAPVAKRSGPPTGKARSFRVAKVARGRALITKSISPYLCVSATLC